MSQDVILDWLSARRPNSYTAAQILYHFGDKISQGAVYANLKKLRDSGQINYLWEEHSDRNVRRYFVGTDNEVSIGWRSRCDTSPEVADGTDLDYFLATEKVLVKLSCLVTVARDHFLGCSTRDSFNNYSRKGFIEETWHDVKRRLK